MWKPEISFGPIPKPLYKKLLFLSMGVLIDNSVDEVFGFPIFYYDRPWLIEFVGREEGIVILKIWS